MKTVILGNTNNPRTKKPNDPYSWFVLTFRQGLELNGCSVKMIDYKSNSIISIRRQLIDYSPKYVFTHLTFHNNPHNSNEVLQLFSELSRSHNIRFIHTCGDAREEDRYSGDVSSAFFAAFVGTYGLVRHGEQKLNIPTYYCPYSSLTYYNMAEPIKELSFKIPVFTGNPTAHEDRSRFITLLKEYGTIKIHKTQSVEDLRHRTPELSTSASSILGLCTKYSVDGYIDVRPFQYLGTGACMIIRKFKNMDNIIPPDLYYPFEGYTRKDAAFVKSTSLRINKTDTWPMRAKAFRFIQQNHSSKVRLNQVLDVLEGSRKDVLL